MILKKIISAVMASAVALSCMMSGVSAYVYPEAEAVIEEKCAAVGEMRGLTAFQLVSDMGAGWNLGNSLEVNSADETAWGNPVTTKAMIDAVAAKGFRTLRIPVRWDMHYSNASSYTIDTSFLRRVEEVVNYGLENDMYVIINIHHNQIQTMVSSDTSVQTRVCSEISSIWTQVGNYFKNYGDKLIFETINEPRCGEDWGGETSYYNCVNKYNEAGRSAIRATGGNNASRLIMMPTYCASSDAPKVEGWKKLANDDMVAVSIHAYLPFDFAFEGGGHSDWQTSDYTSLSGVFTRLHSAFISKGVPVVIGEFGACNKNNTSHRVTYAKSYIALARQFAEENIPCVWWDNNAFGIGSENFGIFNRNSMSFTYDTIAVALVGAYNGDPPYETASTATEVIFSGNASCIAYGQAFSTEEFSFLLNMRSGDKIYAEYSSGSRPTIILQSFTDSSRGWVEIYPDSVSNGVAVWSYESILAAFGGSFDGLGKFYIGARESSLTLTRVYIPKGTAHTHVYNGTSVVTLPASATTNGIRKVCCSVSGCSAYRIEVVPKSGEESGQEGEIADFVERLYVTLLGRASEPQGKATHISRLMSGYSAADTARSFVMGTELASQNISNREFVTRMYRTFMNREPDAAGLASWTKILDNGCSYGHIFQHFSTSNEFTGICESYGIVRGSYVSPQYRDKNAKVTAYVSRMYTVALNRSYDVAGLNTHTKRFITGQKDAKGIAQSFIFSTEFQNRRLNNTQYVECLYNTLFGRPADTAGRNQWVTRLNNGVSRQQVFDSFAGSNEFRQMVASFGI